MTASTLVSREQLQTNALNDALNEQNMVLKYERDSYKIRVNQLQEANESLQEESRKLLIYHPTSFVITAKDYTSLAADVNLNDVIVDFYLKYLHQEVLTQAQSDKSHIFSHFFYKRLTQISNEADPKLNAAQKRHARVANWTRNVNIFEKDFVIIPIMEQSHWFLAIICFAKLSQPHTMDTNQPIKLNPPKRASKWMQTNRIRYENLCKNLFFRRKGR